MAVAGGDSSHLHEQQPQYQQPHQQQPSSLPITTNSLLELFIPGYTLISRVILDHAGLDLNRLVPILLLCFALIKSYDYIYSRAWRILLRFGTCSVSIDSNVDAYFSLTDWLADKGIGRTSTDIIALPLRRPNASQALGGGMYLDPYTSLLPAPGAPRRRKSQHYEPVLESFVRFSYRGRLFIWYRRRERRNLGESANMPTSLIEGRLFCFAWNTQPLQELVEEASEKYHQKRTTSTRIYRPAHKISRDGNGDLWQTAAMRPSRPLETVILDRKQKDSLTSDVQDYLRPTTRRWYAQRGIPYRRGYLLEGPPGTGKTSLSFALAGLFELDIYCISLVEPSITEDNLASLFGDLPEQCLVLLEDVDSAGIENRRLATSHIMDDLAELSTVANSELVASTFPRSRISLSGLLNVIDGVASQEGRILIMTTNNSKALDSALLRPGRVDLRIRFELTSKQDVEDLFVQTYKDHNSVEDLELQRLGKEFASKIPAQKLSAAEIQGYLLKWKNESVQDAVANLGSWLEEMSIKR